MANRPRSLVGRHAGVGLSAGSGGTLDVDLDELTDAAIVVADDSIPFINAAGETKKEEVADFVDAITGNGLEAADGVQAVKAADATINVAASGVSIKAAALKHVLKDGTAAATDVVIAGMAVGDELISVHSQATKAAVATITDRTSEYVIGAGKLVKAAGTDETNNQLDIWYWDRT